MMKRVSVMSALAALGILSFTGVAAASSHREAPSIAADPAADNTDTYAFVSGTNLVVVANYIGLELPEGGPNWAKFSDDVRYEIHIARGPTSLADALTYQIQFTTAAPVKQALGAPLPAPGAGKGTEFFAQLTGSGAFGQTYTVTQLTNGANPTVITTAPVPVPWPNVGPETNAVAYSPALPTTAGAYEAHWVNGGTGPAIGALTGGGSVFAGPRDDPFWVDLGAIFDLAQLRPVANAGVAARDSIAYTNVHAIVLQIPLTVANGGAPIVTSGATTAQADAQTVGVWASASRRKSTIRRRSGADSSYGPWIQVSRLGLPLINEAVIGVQDKDFFNHLTPADDLGNFAGYILNPIIVRDAQAVGLYVPSVLDAAGCDNAMGGADLLSNRMDIVGVINLAPSHTITSIGDLIRVDLGLPSGFPNGRTLTDPTTDVVLGLALCGAANAGALVGAVGPGANEVAFEATFPFLAPPWEGRTANPRLAPSTLGQSGQKCTAGTNCASTVCTGAGTCQ